VLLLPWSFGMHIPTLPPLFPDEAGSEDGLPALPVSPVVALAWGLAVLEAVGPLADETLAR
jgi:hypothetical protein